jgi:hypothetical protein
MLKLKIINFKIEIKKRQVKLDNSSKLKSLIIQDKKKKQIGIKTIRTKFVIETK